MVEDLEDIFLERLQRGPPWASLVTAAGLAELRQLSVNLVTGPTVDISDLGDCLWWQVLIVDASGESHSGAYRDCHLGHPVQELSAGIGAVGLDHRVEEASVLGANAALVYGAADDVTLGDIDLVTGAAGVLQLESGWYNEAQHVGPAVSHSAVLLDFFREVAVPADGTENLQNQVLG